MPFRRISPVAAGVVLSACAALPPDVTPELRGVVVDQATHRPIADATVQIKEFPQSAVKSGGDGSFVIPALPKWHAAWAPNTAPGYHIASEAPGYLARVQRWDIDDDHAQIVTLRRPTAIDDLDD